MTDNNFEYEVEPTKEFRDIMINAAKGMPVLSQLELVKGIIFESGGCQDDIPIHPSLVIAHEIMRHVIGELREHPDYSKLGTLIL